MKLNMIQPKTMTEGLLPSITKNCETLIKQTHTKPEIMLEFRMVKPRETFHFNLPIQVRKDWMLGIVDLEVYNSSLDITKENNNLKLYRFPDEKRGRVSYEKVRDEIERDLDISDFTATNLQDEIKAPAHIKKYREQVTKRMKDDKYMRISAIYVDSVVQDFETFPRTEIDFVEDDLRLVLNENNSTFSSVMN